MKSVVKRVFHFLLIACVTLSVSFGDIAAVGAAPAAATVTAKDIKGNPAEKQIAAWLKKGLLKLYSDKTFRPDRSITRIDLVTIINSAFGFKSTSYMNFNDVKPGTATATEVAKAISAGYIKAFSNGTFRPNNTVTRQEMAEIVCKLLKLSVIKDTVVLNKIKDQKSIPESSKGYVSTVVKNSYFGLYTGSLFKPTKALTRGEAVTLLYRAAGGVFNKPGTYDNSDGAKVVNGNVTINTYGVNLKNIVINGNLYLGEAIAEGIVTFTKVTVKGKTYISGGGPGSILLRDTTLGDTTVYKKAGSLGIIASGSTSVGNLLVNSPCSLQEGSLTGKGFGNLTFDLKSSTGDPIQLMGKFDNVTINSRLTEIGLYTGSITNLTTGTKASNASIIVDSTEGINNLVLNSSANVSGSGPIRTADIRSNGVVVQQTPVAILLKSGITATVGGKTVTQSTPSTPPSTPNTPSISSATLDLASGKLVIIGKNLVSIAGSSNDITASKLTISKGALAGNRQLTTTANADISNAVSATLTLTGADLDAVRSLIQGSTSKTLNLIAAAGWNGPTSTPDFTGNPITVKGNLQPSLTSATLNLSSGQLVLTGVNLVTVSGTTANDITASKLTISDSNGGHSRALSYTSNAEIRSSTTATLTLSVSDLSSIKSWAVQNGVSLNGNAYNIAAAAGWNGSSSPADLTGNPVTVSGNPLPVINSAALNLSNGQLTLYCTNLISISGSSNDITASKLTISDGSGGHSRTLYVSGNADIANSTTAYITVSGDDLTALKSWAVQSGTSVNGYAYNISAAAGWNGPDSLSDLTGNPVTVNGGTIPTITDAALDISTGRLYIYGSNFTSITGSSNDITSNLLTITDSTGGHSRTLYYTGNFDISSSTTASVALSSTDLSYIISWATQNGTSVNGYPYYLNASAGWNGPTSYADTSNTLTISGNSASALSSASLNISGQSNQLVLYGSNFYSVSGSYNDVIAAYITISDSNGGHYRQLISTANVDIYNSSTIYITLSPSDLSAIAAWATQDGTQVNGYTYNLSVTSGWNGPYSVSDSTTTLYVSGNINTTLSSASLNISGQSNQLVLYGSNFYSISGSNNDIVAYYITISDSNGGHYRQLISTASVDIYNSSTAYITVSPTDLSAIAAWATQNGTQVNGYTYNLSVAAGWNGPNSMSDSTTTLTVSGNGAPTITSADLNITNGILTIMGSNFASVTGANNDITPAKITLTDGTSSHSWTLSSTTGVDLSPSNTTVASLLLSQSDLDQVKSWATQIGTNNNGNYYKIIVAAGWNGPNSAADSVGKPLNISGNALQTITGATMDINTRLLTITGTNFINISGTNNDINLSCLSLNDGIPSHEVRLTAAASTGFVEIADSTRITLTLPQALVDSIKTWATQNGTWNGLNDYNLTAYAGWNGTNAPQDTAGNPVTISGYPSAAISNSALSFGSSSATLTLAGSNMVYIKGTGNDIDVIKLTISDGTGSNSTTLTTATHNVDIVNPTTAVISITGADFNSLKGWVTQNGTTLNGRPYNLYANAGWNGSSSVLDAATPVTVSGITNLAPPLTTLPSLSKNGTPNQTVITLAPLLGGNTYRYTISQGSTPVATPAVGYNASNWAPVVSGGVINAVNGWNIGVAEVDTGNCVVRFSNVVAISDVSAPELTTRPVFSDALGEANNGKTIITLGAPSVAGNTFRYFVSQNSNSVTPPVVGADVSSWIPVANGGAITAQNGIHIGVAEVDGTAHVVRFSDGIAVTVNYTPETPAQKIADSLLGASVNFATIIRNGGGTKLILKLNGTNVALNSVEALGDGYQASTNVAFVVAALQADINNALGAGKYIVSSNGSRLIITTVQTGSTAKIDLSGSDAAAAAALGFTSLGEVRGADAQH